MSSKKDATNKKKTVKKKKAPKKEPKKKVESIDEAIDKTGKKITEMKEAVDDIKPRTRKKESSKDISEKTEPMFKFKTKDGTLTSVPVTGKVNVVELRQEDRTDFLFTRLPKELALKYSMGAVRTRYAMTKGDVCVLATKYRGDAIDANMPKNRSECYVLSWCPYYTEMNVELEHINEDISDEDLKHSLFALDESKGLFYKNKWIVALERADTADELIDEQTWSRREAGTRYAAKIEDEVALGRRAVAEDRAIIDMGSVSKWMKKNPMVMFIILLIIFFVTSMFIPRG